METPAWLAGAACRGEPLETFFRPVDIDTGRSSGSWSPLPAQRICARCPVALECLTDAVETGEMSGLWAGAGGDLLRTLRRARREAADHDPADARCTCSYCDAVAGHLERLRTLNDPDVNRMPPAPPRVTPDATHGKSSTYNRGCRCDPCRFSRTPEAAQLRRRGIDPGTWWTARLPDDATYDAARWLTAVWLTTNDVLPRRAGSHGA